MYLITPLKNEDLLKLKAGDIVHLSGTVHTARDKAYARALSGKMFPADIKGGVIFHAGPVVRKTTEGWEMVAIGPTTSSRMDSMEPRFIERFGIGAIIGKGGMGKDAAAALKGKAVYLAMTGGCAAITSSQVTRVAGVDWLDLGIPEAVWHLEVGKLGPLTVAIDAHGNSIYEKQKERTRRVLKEL